MSPVFSVLIFWLIADLREEEAFAQGSQGNAMEQGCTVMHADEDEKVAALEGLQVQVQGAGAGPSKGNCPSRAPAPTP